MGESQSFGEIENAIEGVEGQLRSIKRSVEERYGKNTPHSIQRSSHTHMYSTNIFLYVYMFGYWRLSHN